MGRCFPTTAEQISPGTTAAAVLVTTLCSPPRRDDGFPNPVLTASPLMTLSHCLTPSSWPEPLILPLQALPLWIANHGRWMLELTI